MSNLQVNQIKKKFAPFMKILLVIACMGLLASCSSWWKYQNLSPTVEVRYGVEVPVDGTTIRTVDSTNIVVGEISGAKYIAKEIIVLIKSINDEAEFLPLVKNNGWKIVSYAKDLGMYTIETNANSESELRAIMFDLEKKAYIKVANYNTAINGPRR
jgi:hypothetical protein